MWNHDDINCLRRAREALELSQDPSTRVGAVLAGVDFRPRNRIVGINRLPQGIGRDLSTLPREEKLDIIVHAEMDALMNAARVGYATAGSTLYIVCRDQATGDYWGGAPCTNCGKHVIAAGVRRVVTIDLKKAYSSWRLNLVASQERLFQAGVQYEEIPYDALDR